MGEHMLNALIEGLNELKKEYSETPEKLTYKMIMTNVYKIIAKYTVDRKEILSVFGAGEDLSYNDFKAVKDLEY